MTVKTFIGGVKLKPNKDELKNSPIKIILPGRELVYPLAGYGGAAAKALVKAGDKVLSGQKIGAAIGFDSVCVHASVSGTVRAVEERRIASGCLVESIVVENDGLYDEIDYPAPKPLEEMSNSEIISRIQDAGIVGLGGFGFPAHIKLSPPNPDKISCLIINAVECEPFISANYRRMIEDSDRLISSFEIFFKLFPYSRIIIALSDDKAEYADILKEKMRKEVRAGVKILKNKYPQGSERQIITATTGRSINSTKTAADVGCILFNIETVIGIQRAVIGRKNLTSRIITFAGDAVRKPQNLKVRIGTIYNDLIEGAGGLVAEAGKIICGGQMRGHALPDTFIPLTKTDTALLCFIDDTNTKINPSACINCGRCAVVCPEGLMPARLSVFSEHDDSISFVKYNGAECLECACCGYICPAKLNLTGSITSMKHTICELKGSEDKG